MTKRMLIDATQSEETRIAIVSGNKLEEYDYETLVRKQIKSNIYLVKVTRVEPSLQAAFVDFSGNRHGFLPFPEIHPDYYRIPIADREALIAEERAIAAAQAAKEDAEDAAELAASGESIDDLDLNIEPPSNVETVAPPEEFEPETLTPVESLDQDGNDSPTAIAEDFDAPEITDASSDTADAPDSADAADGSNAHEKEKDPDVENIGGDMVDAPIFRSSIKRHYKIQEVIKRNQIMLIQISKEERGNKGAAVTTYISLPGRYCVLMPNSPRGGGVSRKVSNAKDRQRLKKILHELNVPEGMSVILRTAGVSRTIAEIKRDLDYLLRLWNEIRELTLKSTAPALIYEEGNLIKRAIRDLYKRDIDEVLVAGEESFKNAQEFMRILMPSHVDRVIQYQETQAPLFFRYQVEGQIDAIHSPTVHLKSGGYIVINPTEALVSIDVNSGRATKGRHIEETALKTNLEAAEEIARQLRLRDLGGLVVIDFIDMEDRRSNRIVERRLRDAMQHDRARIQLGRISAFGLLELSRQRLNPSLVETNFETCKHCTGSGLVRTVETSAVMVLRGIEEEGMKGRAAEIKVSVPTDLALYIFNMKRDMLAMIEQRHHLHVLLHADENLVKPNYVIEITRTTGAQKEPRIHKQAPVQTVDISDLPDVSDDGDTFEGNSNVSLAEETEAPGNEGTPRQETRHGRRHDRDGDQEGGRRNNRRRGNRGGRRRGGGNRPHREHGAERTQPTEAGGTPASSDNGTPTIIPIQTPRHESNGNAQNSHTPSAPATGNESSDGGNRKGGWWKRLTE